MEIRCGSCEKLFRVSDDKITGTGIKFPCTRCGEYVRITREDFDHYTMSRSAVSVLDLFEQNPRPAAPTLTPDAAKAVADETAPPAQESTAFTLVAPSTHEEVLEKEPSLSAEPDQVTPAPEVKLEQAAEIKPEPSMLEQKVEPAVESQSKPEPDLSSPVKQKSEPPIEPHPEPKPETVRPTAPTAPPLKPQIRPAVPKKETTRPSAPAVSHAAERSVNGPVPSTPSRSGRMLMILFGALIIAGLAAYGIFVYLQESPQGGKEKAHDLISIEGLQLANPGEAWQPNGDLLITGVIRNDTDKQRNDWYVVTEVYDAKGAVLSRIRILNGKQIYSRNDYDILAGRGANVQELKAKNLQSKGVVIPPKGSVNFEMLYLKPPANISSFNTQVLPFDSVQLSLEISREIK